MVLCLHRGNWLWLRLIEEGWLKCSIEEVQQGLMNAVVFYNPGQFVLHVTRFTPCNGSHRFRLFERLVQNEFVQLTYEIVSLDSVR